MKLVKSGEFDGYQQALTRLIVLAVKQELEQAQAPSDRIRELTENIAFAVTSLIDDTAGMEVDGKPVSPLLTFLNEDQDLEFANGNSWMHEYVYAQVDRVFATPLNPCANDHVT